MKNGMCNYNLIPEYMLESINDYVKYGHPMGGFLMCVFSNDLFGAYARADDLNMRLIPTYVCYIWNELPVSCHGSENIVKNYMKQKRDAL